MNCDRTGCTDTATLAPKICVPAKDWPIDMHQPAEVIIGVRCCEKHAKEIVAADFLNAKLRQVFEILLRGKQPPDFGRAFVRLIPVDSDEFKRLEGAKP